MQTNKEKMADARVDEEQENELATRRQRRINNFLLLARSAQNAHDKWEQEEQRLVEEERKAWDETIEQIREIQAAYDFDR